MLEVNNIDGHAGDASELEIEVIETESPKSIHSEAENKSDLPDGPRDSESSVIDQILSTGSGGLSKDLDYSTDAGQQQSKEAKVFSN